MLREIALDTETTGLNPKTGDRIVEIGCVEMRGNVRSGEVFHVYLNPERSMPKAAEAVHGLSDDFLRDKPLFSEIVDAFLEFIDDAPLIIHNASFDMGFLTMELERCGKAALPMQRAVDTVTMARKKFPGQPASLDALCRRFNIDNTHRTRHGALLDAELLADVYLELQGGRQTLLALEQQQEDVFKQQTIVSAREITVKRRYFSLSEEERTAHRTFLESLKDPAWYRYGVLAKSDD
ncbi:MAG: DNA polymerase III subunit epsilon [Rickettsiales bacterium]|nr:DNA polymerase III subunit epsilon [Rickettsiales bacterium]